MNKTHEEKLRKAILIKQALAELLTLGAPLTPEEEAKACDLYGQAVVMVARLS